MGETILIVEDDADVAWACQETLDGAGLHAVIAASAETAATEAAALRPALMLLDLMMPVVDGWDVARRLRTNPATRDIPIVVMTAMHHARDRAAEIGTPWVLAKPFNLFDLLRVVEDVLRSVAA